MKTPTVSPRRGFYLETNAQNPAKPYRLKWVHEGRRLSQSFASVEDRAAAVEALAEKREEFGREVLSFDPREWRTWLAFKEKIGGADPLQVAHEWLAGRASGGLPSKSLTVGEAVAKYYAHRLEGSLSAATISHFKKHLMQRLTGSLGHMKLHELTADHLRGWLASLRHPKTGAPMEPVTRRHHRKDANTFLEHCIVEGWIQRNPCAAVAVPAVPVEEVSLLSVEQVRELFSKAAKSKAIGRLALEAFGFMRSSSAGRAQLADIKFDSRGLRMPGAEHKSGKTKFRQGHPENLWAWLKFAPAECWDLSPSQYRYEKRVAFGIAGLGDSENRLRKTCLSAHLAWQKNQPLTSYLAQHRHTSTTEIYLGEMEEADGKAYFEITPPTP